MDTIALRQLILATPLQEQPVTIANWIDPVAQKPVNLLIRELDGRSGSDLIAGCTDVKTSAVDQDALVAGIVLATLRNADDPNKALVFSSDPVNKPNDYDPAYRDSLMATGLGDIMQVAQASIKLSGLDAAASTAQAKNA